MGGEGPGCLRRGSSGDADTWEPRNGPFFRPASASSGSEPQDGGGGLSRGGSGDGHGQGQQRKWQGKRVASGGCWVPLGPWRGWAAGAAGSKGAEHPGEQAGGACQRCSLAPLLPPSTHALFFLFPFLSAFSFTTVFSLPFPIAFFSL